ncbi:hypothetical protein GCM10010300_81650 [Streptomyces olivaceoviridis]|nr:hypothetical protein GCM10010300_81650 [Streptomyces olivaceoviridis]
MVAQPLRGQRDGGEFVGQAEFGEFPDGVRQQVDPHADGLDGPCRLPDPRLESGGVQAQGAGQAGYAPTHDADSHRPVPVPNMCEGGYVSVECMCVIIAERKHVQWPVICSVVHTC